MRTGRTDLGVRHRVIRNSLRWKNRNGLGDALPDKLKSGEMRLRSFYTPGLQPGNYTIKVDQSIVAGDASINPPLEAHASFHVPEPTWDPLNLDLVHSTFPPPGIPAQNHILPHIVFNDPHLPWQKIIKEDGSALEIAEQKVMTKDDPVIPWLAVIAFEQNEVVVAPYDGPFRRGPVGQNPVGEKPKAVNYVSMKRDLFLALFTSKNAVNLTRYQYLAHVREVNIEHMTDVRNKDYTGDLDDGTFSVVFSHRTGPFLTEGCPTRPCIVHVVALDSVKANFIDGETLKVVTLFNWTYDCLPPSTINFKDTMMKVGNNSGVLRAPGEISEKLDPIIRERIEAGYTLVRYRVQTGEETVALMRGPFTPFGVTGGEEEWFKVKSNSGEDLQIIDTSLGVIDISYCAAWQIGKALAIADQAFSAALLRIRGYVHNTSSEARKQRAITVNYKDSRSKELISRLKSTFNTVANFKWETAAEEVRYSRKLLVQTRYRHILDKKFQIDRHNDIKQLGERLGGLTAAIGEPISHFTELKDPQSTDWKLVLNWLMDKIFLEGIPPYYLICDPTWLPLESIRFFYVDEKWLSALVDGALSVCNHLDKDDTTREAIKAELLYYIEHELHPDFKYPPQLPRYGFYMRSVAVSALPDMVLRAPLPDGDKRAEVLRQENVAKNVLLCLFDRSPTGEGDKKLTKVQFSQPPHQQCFTFCNESLKKTELEVEIRKVYSKAASSHKMDKLDSKKYTNPPKCDVYDWSSRTIDLDGYGKLVTDTLQHGAGDDLYKGPANATLIGIQLNDPIYRLTFSADTSTSPGVFSIPVVSPERVADLSMSTSADFSVDTEPRYNSECLTAGKASDEPNYLIYNINRTDVVFSLIRKDDLPVDVLRNHLTRVAFTIPLALFEEEKDKDKERENPPVHDARMLRNIRLLPMIEVKQDKVIVTLIPKAHDGTLLEHNKDLSFLAIGARLKLKAKDKIHVTESYKECADSNDEFDVEVVEN